MRKMEEAQQRRAFVRALLEKLFCNCAVGREVSILGATIVPVSSTDNEEETNKKLETKETASRFFRKISQFRTESTSNCE